MSSTHVYIVARSITAVGVAVVLSCMDNNRKVVQEGGARAPVVCMRLVQCVVSTSNVGVRSHSAF